MKYKQHVNLVCLPRGLPAVSWGASDEINTMRHASGSRAAVSAVSSQRQLVFGSTADANVYQCLLARSNYCDYFVILEVAYHWLLDAHIIRTYEWQWVVILGDCIMINHTWWQCANLWRPDSDRQVNSSFMQWNYSISPS